MPTRIMSPSLQLEASKKGPLKYRLFTVGEKALMIVHGQIVTIVLVILIDNHDIVVMIHDRDGVNGFVVMVIITVHDYNGWRR